MRLGRRRPWTSAIIVAVLPLLGCQTGSPGATPSSPPSPVTRLQVAVTSGKATPAVTTLTCDPAGGSHLTPDAACTALAEHGRSSLPPVPKGRICTQLYGGPETATVTGTWQGQPVDSTFSRINGCEIKRWENLTGLLPKPGT